MDRWDEAAADAAIASLARHAGSNEVYEIFFRYGARDFRSIGHKAIYVANSRRTLQCIGWQHAEPVLRSLAYALLNHEDGNPAERDDPADRPWRRNQELARTIRDDWQGGEPNASATEEMLDTLRNADNEACCQKVVELLNRGTAPQSIWDALLDGAGELLMRQAGIVSLHSATSTNALRYAYQSSDNDETRRLLMLQNAAFLPMFRDAMGGRGKVKDVDIAKVEPVKPSTDKPEGAIEEIFAEVSQNRDDATRKTLAYLSEGGDPTALIDAARRLVFLKGNDAHDYKFSSAALEDYYHISPKWRDRYLAASMQLLPGSGDRDNSLVERTRAALKA